MLTVAQKIGAYARLLRLSNGPTAIADVWMGYAVATGTLEPTTPLALMSLASLCLYHGGMVLNDAVDAQDDATDNRGRPIAAGLITRSMAYRIAWGMLSLGIGLSFAAGTSTGSVGIALALAVILYNSPLKKTVWGLWLMAACRVLNGVLGMSVVLSIPPVFAVGPGVFAYVLGLTWLARYEVEGDGGSTESLKLALCVSLGGIGWLATATPIFFPAATPREWIFSWAVVTLVATRGMAAAILQPTPQKIGRGVGIAIQGLVVIDAVLAAFYAGPVAGLAILALLPVTMILAQWIPQT